MNRVLQYVNLGGVLALAVLCAVQWRQNRTLNLSLNAQEKTRQAQEQKLAEQEKSVRGLNDDLARFKEQVPRIHEELNATKDKFRAAEQLGEKVTAERDQLQASLTNWMLAVADRDARIKEANERITEVVGHLNTSVEKFNTLVTNYNNVVKELNEARAGSSEKKP